MICPQVPAHDTWVVGMTAVSYSGRGAKVGSAVSGSKFRFKVGKWMPVYFLWSKRERCRKETQPQNFFSPDQEDNVKGTRGFHSHSLSLMEQRKLWAGGR